MRFILRTLFHQNGHFSATFFSSKGKRRFLALWEERFKTVKSGFMGTSSTAPRSPFPSGEGFLYHRACGFIPERVTNDNAGGGGDSRSAAPSPKRTRVAKPSPLELKNLRKKRIPPSCHPEQATTPCGCLRVELSKICNKLLIFESQNACSVLRIYEGRRAREIRTALPFAQRFAWVSTSSR